MSLTFSDGTILHQSEYSVVVVGQTISERNFVSTLRSA